MKQPEDVHLSREEGEALIERIERNALSAEDRQLLVKLLKGEWGISGGRRARFYRLTPAGQRKLQAETQKWSAFARGVSRLLLGPE